LVLLAIGWLVAACAVVPLAAQGDEPVARAVLFWSEGCPHCHNVLDETLPLLQERYVDQLEIRAVEISDPVNYELWVAAMESFQVPPEQQVVPMLFIGDTALVGSVEIPEKLPGLIDRHLAAGGVDYPAIPGLLADPAPTPTSSASSTLRLTPTVKACHICDEDILPPATLPPPQGPVHFWLFWDSHCGDCQVLKEEILPPILSRYEEGQVVVRDRDLEKGGFEWMRALEHQYGLEQGEIPEVFIGEYALLGIQEIHDRLPELLDQYLAQGGVALMQVDLAPTPTADGLLPGSEQAGSPRSATAEPLVVPLPIHLAYFYQPGCRECDRVQLALDYLKKQYPQLSLCALDVKEHATLCESLGEQTGVPTGKRLTAPAVFVGGEALVGDELHTRSLEALLARYAETGAGPICQGWEMTSDATASGIVARFRSFRLLTILGAGLVDGLNPCAFATLVFFVSYLTFMGRRGRQVLAAGAAFTLGVFLTYLGVGFGVLRFLAALPFVSAISHWVYGFTAILCLVLAAGSLHDWWRARRGRHAEMRLKLPTRLRRWINRAVREGAGVRAFVPVTLGTGVVVSVIELACTGQVYLPTILFVLGVPELRLQGGLYLLLYNLMFILPLVVVFVLAYFGTTSRQLGLVIHRHTAVVKLATAGLFALLAVWMLVSLLC
jgi:cytochrome c biogenesis protein CcdA